jgi:hypothetical protein
MSYEHKINEFKSNIDLKLGIVTESNLTKIDSLDDIINLIKKECKPFLKYKQLLYRGMRSDGSAYGIKKVRTDRTPLQTNPVIYDLLNSFLKEIGLPPRSEVLFASVARHNTSYYGTSFIIFPRGDFSFAWHTKISDMINLDMSDIIDTYGPEEPELEDILNSNDNAITKCKNIVEELTRLNIKYGNVSVNISDFKEEYEFLSQGKKLFNTKTFPPKDDYKELMIKCKDYYFIEFDRKSLDIIHNELNVK